MGIGTEATWNIAETSVQVNGQVTTYSSPSSTGLMVANGTLSKDSEGVLRYTVTGSTVPLFLFRSTGATNSFTAAVQGQSPSGRALTGISNIRVVIQNTLNSADRREVVTGADGGLTATETIVGDDYKITVPQQTKVPSAIEAVVTPLYDGQNLGILNLVTGGANFKMNLRTDVRPDLLLADATTIYPVAVEITNIGAADLDEANYSVSSLDGLTVASGMAADILGTVFAGQKKTIAIGIRCPEIGTEWEDKRLNVQVTDGMATRSWTDSVSLRFLKNREQFSLNVASQSGINGLVVDPDGRPHRIGSGATAITWKPGLYTLAFGGGGTGSETKYGVGLDTAARTDWDSLTNTAIGEPNNSLEQATALELWDTALQYLGAKDVDFFRFEIPIGFLDVISNLTPGIHNGAQTVTISPNYEGATIKYTKDFSMPSADNGTLWTGGSISVSAEESLYLYIYKEHYFPKTIRLVDRSRMVSVPAGSFHNGTSTVTLSAFMMSNTEVTQAQYQTVTGTNPSYFPGDTSRHVEQVSWYDAAEFCNLLSISEGKAPVYTITERTPSSGYPITSATVTMDRTKGGYRLPTEAEWEWAARGATLTHNYIYAGSNAIDGVAWYYSNSGSTTHAVGAKAANELGLYDMSGNVFELCWDWYGIYPSGAQTDPLGAASGTNRVVRGDSWGSWDYGGASSFAVAYRNGSDPDRRDSIIWFRVSCP